MTAWIIFLGAVAVAGYIWGLITCPGTKDDKDGPGFLFFIFMD